MIHLSQFAWTRGKGTELCTVKNQRIESEMGEIEGYLSMKGE